MPTWTGGIQRAYRKCAPLFRFVDIGKTSAQNNPQFHLIVSPPTQFWPPQQSSHLFICTASQTQLYWTQCYNQRIHSKQHLNLLLGLQHRQEILWPHVCIRSPWNFSNGPQFSFHSHWKSVRLEVQEPKALWTSWQFDNVAWFGWSFSSQTDQAGLSSESFTSMPMALITTHCHFGAAHHISHIGLR